MAIYIGRPRRGWAWLLVASCRSFFFHPDRERLWPGPRSLRRLCPRGYTADLPIAVRRERVIASLHKRVFGWENGVESHVISLCVGGAVAAVLG